jgi:hypothetical protein
MALLQVPVDPTGGNDEHERLGLEAERHGSPNPAEEQEGATPGMTFGVSSGRKPSLIDLETLKDYGHFGFD